MKDALGYFRVQYARTRSQRARVSSTRVPRLRHEADAHLASRSRWTSAPVIAEVLAPNRATT
jgi:hypothetical protein